MIPVKELSSGIPYQFPFVAYIRGQVNDHKRTDTACIVTGFMGMETTMLRVKIGNQLSVASDSMLYTY
jgi:hypothetical protein